ncbi:MAG: 30S ribosomal protein S4 [Dehalococcoidales bacterium]|jgi:small subunit ribosomal protein S4|nr:30S ribosomal protein S4 [Dehalococcoidales bacterium]MDD5604659.1 30S ribosomal protein S4 [Dehalococcoidales bacterium]MDX9986135.1 30S ribosomal protein S4 [Dehalococcoidales bacterium]NLE89483.1 30S ribosomal protein S4 [Dehalococcoidales bacterium]
MARYTEARCRLCRRSGEKLMLKGDKCLTRCVFDKKPKAPGPQTARRRRISDHGVQLREKQKVRFSYGLMERQLRRFFAEANRQPGVTGDNLITLLERRLDNAVFRLGFADSLSQARQIVRHGHITLNGRKTNIPSCMVQEGDVIGWREGSRKTEYYKQLVENIGSKTTPQWLSVDKTKMEGQVVTPPTPEDVGIRFDTAAVVEYYSR